MKFKMTLTGTALAALALVFPVGATAQIDTAVSSVRAHTTMADSALDRAVALFEANRDRRGTRVLVRSRREIGQANADAAKLLRQAEGPRQHVQAARAQSIVASQRDDNIEPLLDVLEEPRGRAQNMVAQAALADTRGRDKAIAILDALSNELPSQAGPGIARAMASLAMDRDEEIESGAETLANETVSPRSKQRVAGLVRSNVNGQATAAERLAELIASEEMPEQAMFGLTRAYDAVTGEHESTADALEQLSDQMPARVQAFVERIVQLARNNAQSLREERPAPPAGRQGSSGSDNAPSRG